MEVSEIIDAVDIVEYMSQFCEFEEKGGELWSISPFNPEEKTPSFSLHPDKKYFYDFSVGFGGNVIDFIMKKNQTDLRGAVNELKRFAHITEKDGELVTRMEAARIARKYRYREKAKPVMTAHILPENCMERYEFRRDKLQLWVDEGISWNALKKFQVRYDSIDNRIVYPIRDYDGKIFSISGRTCDPDFKAKGLRKYTYLGSIGTLATIYGYSVNKKAIERSGEIILFEGAKSVMLAHSWGIENTGALLTSHLSQNQFEFLLKLSSFHHTKIVFALDSDVDISKDDRIKKLCAYANVEWVQNRGNLLEPKMAPVDKGREVWDRLYVQRRRLS